MKIAEVHYILVDNTNLPHPCSCQIDGCWTAQSSSPNNEHRSLAKPVLSCKAPIALVQLTVQMILSVQLNLQHHDEQSASAKWILCFGMLDVPDNCPACSIGLGFSRTSLLLL